MNFDQVEKSILKIITTKTSDGVVQDIVNILYDEFEYYSWVGIYIIKDDYLILGPWKGKQATEHTKIPIGQGICGSAAQSGKTEIVPDVSADGRYLSCFLSTRSEIVVPILRKGIVIGEIDIDSDRKDAFSYDDRVFLEKIADMLSKHIC